MIGIIVNPHAGAGRTMKKLSKIKKWLDKKKINYEMATTDSKEEGREKFSQFLEKHNRIVFIGGDGTLNSALQIGINRKIDKLIGMVSLGSGNDFTRSIFEKNLSFEEILERAFFGKGKSIDAGILESEDKKFIFLNGCGFGIDSQTAKKSEELKIFRGILRYLISLFFVLKKFESPYIKINSHDFNYEGEITLITFGNGKYVGGGFKLTPLADPSDGKLDVSIIKKLSKFQILQKLPKAIMGNHIYDPYCIYGYFGNPVEIEGEGNYLFHLDGEIYEIKGKRVFIKIKKEFFKISA